MNRFGFFLVFGLLVIITIILAIIAFGGGDEPQEVIIKDTRSIHCRLYGACDNG